MSSKAARAARGGCGGAEEIVEAPEVEVVEDAAVEEGAEATETEGAVDVAVEEAAAEDVAASATFNAGVVLRTYLVDGLKSLLKRLRLSDVAC